MVLSLSYSWQITHTLNKDLATKAEKLTELLEECSASYNGQRIDHGSSSDKQPDDLLDDLKQLLQSYQMVFSIPHGLPPLHYNDCQIILQSDAPVRVRSYCYPFSKKDATEDIISQMLLEGLSAYAREMYAIIEAVAKFRHYLIGHFFTICTDQKSLQHRTDQTLQTPEQEQWLPKLLGFQFAIEYKLGTLNTVADALSRSFYMVHLRRKQKLGFRFFGPFPIMERIGEVAYRFKLPKMARIHDVFHISQLKLWVGDVTSQHLPHPLPATENGHIVSPIAILKFRQV
ncbi:Transposon Ty3-G Gag-Pol polyprotein [Senna tora]|uniref:Transposon Ty3-G Gag-Pol polyprotein n=1 Tax=Senna tora TaxID=362788 RepID=A0A834TLX1_9FABA|nr:Transposon Ty3-G Gag-Pol polyprotein [Senna tora]